MSDLEGFNITCKSIWMHEFSEYRPSSAVNFYETRPRLSLI